MKIVVAQLARLLLALSMLYGGVLVLCALLAPAAASSAPIDTARAAESPYLTEPKYVFFGRSRLDSERPKLLLLGASNTMAGFKQREVGPLLPNYEVHNIAIGGANLHELEQIVELVHEVQSESARRRNTWVVGLWYGLFASDEARWHTPDRHAGDTDIDIERYRYGFYRRTQRGAEPLLPPTQLASGEALISPYLMLDRVARDVTAGLREKLSGKPRKLTDAERNARVISQPEQQDYLKFWRAYMGNVDALDDAQFQRLEQLVAHIESAGGRVLLVDLPIPSWHQQGSALAADYRARIERQLPKLCARSGVKALRLAEQNTDEDFSDEVHPKPRVTPDWAARLERAVRENFGPSLIDPTAKNDHESTTAL